MNDFPKHLKDLDPDIFLSDNYLVIDKEIDTSGGHYGLAVVPENHMLLNSVKLGPDHPFRKAHEIDKTFSNWGDELHQDNINDLIEQADFIVAHNAKYELGWLKREGVDILDVLAFDTKIAEYVLFGNLSAGDKVMQPKPLDLNSCMLRRGVKQKDPAVDIMIKHGINPINIPRPWLQGRCEKDVTDTETLFLEQREHLKNTGRMAVMFTRAILTPVLATIEDAGMALDCERVQQEYDKHRRELVELSSRMDDMTGGINWNSPKQIGEFIYETLKFPEFQHDRGKNEGKPIRTPSGNRLTSQQVLARLVPKTRKQREFLELKAEIGKVKAALSKNLEFFQGICEERGGVLKAQFNQTVTATHRLSSSGIPIEFKMFEGISKSVQFQNLPNQFKRLFTSRKEGWLIGEVDGSQLEFRVAGFLGDDDQIRDDIKNHHDVHKFTGSVIFHAPDEWLDNIADYVKDLEKLSDKVTKGERKSAKAHTFKPLYGGSSGSKREQAYYAAFKERYKALASTQLQWAHRVVNDKRLITPWGLRYYWPYASMSRSGYINVTSAVYNYPVQALATAEIIPVAVTYFQHRVHQEGLDEQIVLINTVHDSLICEVHPNHKDDFRRIAIQAFGRDVYNYLKEVYNLEFNVPLGAGIMLSNHWADDTEGEEESYDIHINGKVERI